MVSVDGESENTLLVSVTAQERCRDIGRLRFPGGPISGACLQDMGGFCVNRGTSPLGPGPKPLGANQAFSARLIGLADLRGSCTIPATWLVGDFLRGH